MREEYLHTCMRKRERGAVGKKRGGGGGGGGGGGCSSSKKGKEMWNVGDSKE